MKSSRYPLRIKIARIKPINTNLHAGLAITDNCVVNDMKNYGR